MRRLRWIALVAVLMVPSCHDDDDDRDVDLTIANAGTATVRCEVEYWDWHSHDYRTAVFNVGGGASYKMSIYQRWADVLVIRLPDGAVLFDNVLDYWDFGDDDATITVFP